jgi:hypothetical protein
MHWILDTGDQRGVSKIKGFQMLSTPGRIRTCDRRIRNPLLYPTELRGLLLILIGSNRQSSDCRCFYPSGTRFGTRFGNSIMFRYNSTRRRTRHRNQHFAGETLQRKGIYLSNSIGKTATCKPEKPSKDFPLFAPRVETVAQRRIRRHRFGVNSA